MNKFNKLLLSILTAVIILPSVLAQDLTLGLAPRVFAGGIMLLIVVLAVVFRSKLANTILALSPLKKSMTIIAVIVIGLILGGIAFFPALYSSATGLITGQITAEPVSTGVIVVDACYYEASSTEPALGGAGNCTATENTDDQSRYYIDCQYADVTETAGDWEAQVNISCCRTGDTSEGGTVVFKSRGPDFVSQLDPSSATMYNLFELTSSQSQAFPNEFATELYVGETSVSTSSKKEREYIDYAEEDSCVTVPLLYEIDQQGFGQLNNNTIKSVPITADGKTVFTVDFRKLA